MKETRRSGVLMPLFSLRSDRSWGIGEIPDLAGFTAWLARAGQSFVQLLPVNELPPGERSPYSSLTAMALDPVFVALAEVPDFAALGGDEALEPEHRAALAQLRQDSGIDYRAVRALKETYLRRAWEHFSRVERGRESPRAARFDAFVAREAWWLDEYAAFRALSVRFEERAWWDWPEALAAHDREALNDVAASLDDEIGYRKYLQWLADEQWREMRRRASPVQVFGDLPFMVSANSPDVWARQDEFRRDATVGVPPDAFSDDGQDWGLPPWRWEVMAANDFAWMRQRARRSADLYDGFRLDHLVGLYRTYIRPLDQSPAFFSPEEEDAQIALGEKLVRIYQESGAEITAEDLGTVPDFVRESLARLEVPGYKVLRWERRWDEPDQPFIDTGDYPEIAVATPGTHDSEPLAEWWAVATAEERAAIVAMPGVAAFTGAIEPPEAMTPQLRDAIIRALLASPARIVIFPMADLFGWPDRINTPGTIDDRNWSWRCRHSVEALASEREAIDRAAELLAWTSEADRWPR